MKLRLVTDRKLAIKSRETIKNKRINTFQVLVIGVEIVEHVNWEKKR